MFNDRAERQKKTKEFIDKGYDRLIVKGKNFGDLKVIGKKPKKAAKWLEDKLKNASIADEIRAVIKCQEDFDVLVLQSHEYGYTD